MTFEDYLKENFNLESCTTFWSDFGIADRFGISAVKDTFNRSRYWVSDVKMWTELTIVLNLRCHQHYNNGREELSKVYADLFYQARDMGLDKYQGHEEEFEYYYRTID